MIEVDEDNFIIVTDIDRLMQLVASQRRIELGKLAKELKMRPKEVKKWLHILEDEGLIKIEHKLTKVYAIWAGEPAKKAPEKKKEKPASRKEMELPQPMVEVKGEEELEKRFRPFTIEEIAPLEEELLEFRPKKEEKISVPKNEEEALPSVVRQPALQKQQIEKPKKKELVAAPTQIKVSDFTKMPKVEADSLKAKLDDYLTLIRESKKELKDLESEKERLYREGYLSLEKEFEATLENIQLSILEKERRIIEAKEKAAELPTQVEELEKLQQAISEIEQKSKSILSRTKGQVDEKADAIHKASQELAEQIAQGEAEAMHERAKMLELKELLASIQSNEENLRKAIEENSRAMEEAKARIEQLEDSLGDVVDARTLLSERIDAIHTGLERKIKSLEELKKEAEEIERLEGWFREYSQDYARKLSELEAYVAGNQQEISKLMEAAELEYVKKYLEELSKAEEKYRSRFQLMEMQNAEIEQMISETKERIRQLLAESTRLMEQRRSKIQSSSFDTSEAKKNAEARASMLEEKAKERKNLLDAFGKSRERKKK